MASVRIELSDDEIEEIQRLAKDTLLTLMRIVHSHVQSLPIDDVEKIKTARLWDYALLMRYIAGLLRAFLDADAEAMEIISSMFPEV